MSILQKILSTFTNVGQEIKRCVKQNNLYLPFKYVETLQYVDNGSNQYNYKYKYTNIPYDGFLVWTTGNQNVNKDNVHEANMGMSIIKAGFETVSLSCTLNYWLVSLSAYVSKGCDVNVQAAKLNTVLYQPSLKLYHN